MIILANVVVQAKASGSDIYASAIDALTLLGNSMYEFSMKPRELLNLKSPQVLSHCVETSRA